MNRCSRWLLQTWACIWSGRQRGRWKIFVLLPELPRRLSHTPVEASSGYQTRPFAVHSVSMQRRTNHMTLVRGSMVWVDLPTFPSSHSALLGRAMATFLWFAITSVRSLSVSVDPLLLTLYLLGSCAVQVMHSRNDRRYVTLLGWTVFGVVHATVPRSGSAHEHCV